MNRTDNFGLVQFFVSLGNEAIGTKNMHVKLHNFLTKEQIQKMATRPEWIFQAIGETIRRYEFAYKFRPQLHVLAIASVNLRADQFLLDPTVDFANITNRQDSIIPLLPRTCDSNCKYVVEEYQKTGKDRKITDEWIEEMFPQMSERYLLFEFEMKQWHSLKRVKQGQSLVMTLVSCNLSTRDGRAKDESTKSSSYPLFWVAGALKLLSFLASKSPKAAQ
jgi:hypothetical protein